MVDPIISHLEWGKAGVLGEFEEGVDRFARGQVRPIWSLFEQC